MSGHTIEIEHPLSDRPLKYGRNVMALSSVILVLAYVPYIEVSKFKPLGFDLSVGGEISIWGILGIILLYYAFQFGVAAWLDYRVWIYSNPAKFPPDNMERRPAERLSEEQKQRGYVLRRFIFLDVVIPTVLFLVAIIACGQEIYPLF